MSHFVPFFLASPSQRHPELKVTHTELKPLKPENVFCSFHLPHSNTTLIISRKVAHDQQPNKDTPVPLRRRM